MKSRSSFGTPVGGKAQGRGKGRGTARRRLGSPVQFETLESRMLLATLVGLSQGQLIRFESTTPGTIDSTVTITGLQLQESLHGIDVRPATGQLYGLSDAGNLYTIDVTTGVASARVPLSADPGDTTAPFVGLQGSNFGVDFNPVADRLRVTSNAGQNLRINVDNGQVITDGTLAYASGDPNSLVTPNIVGSAYTNSFAGATSTTLFDIDSNLDILAIQNPPNAGTLNTVGSLGFNPGPTVGFDVSDAGETLLSVDESFSAFNTSSLYSINLATGAATLIGQIGSSLRVSGIAALPTPAISIGDVTVNEGAGQAILTVTLSSPSPLPVTVNFTTADGTATAGQDYTTTSGTVTISAGQRSATISIPIIDDTIFEGTETFFVNLLPPATNATIADGTGIVTIIDNDPLPNIVTPPFTRLEGDSGTTPLTFFVTREQASGLPSSVDFRLVPGTATAEIDYAPISGRFTIPASEEPNQRSSNTFTIQIFGDLEIEPDETFTIVYSNPVNINPPADQVVTILNDDTAIQFAADTFRVDEAAGTATITITRVADTFQPVTVQFSTMDGTAVAGQDYTAVSQTVTFNPGELSRTVTIPILDDTIVEGDQTVRLILSNPGPNPGVRLGAFAAATLVIADDDLASGTLADVRVVEGDPGDANMAVLTFTLDAPAERDVIIDFATASGTATAGQDFQAVTARVTIPAGQTTATFAVPIVGDFLIEGDETFTVTASEAAAMGGPGRLLATAVVTIADDDTLVVTNTNDAGPGSLRNAIEAANALPGRNMILFNIPGAGVQTIRPLSALPGITDAVVIDGWSQQTFVGAAFGGAPLIEISGNLVAAGGPLTNGLLIAAGNSVVRGLVINRFSSHGIVLQDLGRNTIAGNYIGTDATGRFDAGNAGLGIFVANVGANMIGGDTLSARNLISANGGCGVLIMGAGASGNVIQGNFIGTDITGQQRLGNMFDGISVVNAAGTIIGGLAPAPSEGFSSRLVAPTGNLISGNWANGISIIGLFAMNSVIQGNFVGTNADGTREIGNDQVGVRLVCGSGTIIGDNMAGSDISMGLSGRGNLISGNIGDGLLIAGFDASSAVVQGNFIGTNLAGNARLSNGGHGIQVIEAPGVQIGGPGPGPGLGLGAAGNLISGNALNGIRIIGGAVNARIEGNYIGTALNGDAVRTGDPLMPNLLFNGLNGIEVRDTTGVVIGGGLTDPSGLDMTLKGAGVGLAAAGNLISGNAFNGILIASGSDGARISGNIIGTDRTGLGRVPNAFAPPGTPPEGGSLPERIDRLGGIRVSESAGVIIGGDPGAGNLISGNGRFARPDQLLTPIPVAGVLVEGMGSQGVQVRNNRIGTELTGQTNVTPGPQDLGNAAHGIFLSNAANGLILDNVISGNGTLAPRVAGDQSGVGVYLFGEGAQRNQIARNHIGVDASGLRGVPNSFVGVLVTNASNNLIGGMDPADANVISGNEGSGVIFFQTFLPGEPGGRGLASGNVVMGNIIGLDAAGQQRPLEPIVAGGPPSAARPFTQTTGVLIQDASRNFVLNNVISGQGGDTPATMINRIGVGVNIFNDQATQSALAFVPSENTIQGNFIGTRRDGLRGALVPAQQVQPRNLATSTGNSGDGILVRDSPNNVIGGEGPGQPNLIADNGGNGVFLAGPLSTGNRVINNIIGLALAAPSTPGAPLSVTTPGTFVPAGNRLFGILVSEGSRGNMLQDTFGTIQNNFRGGILTNVNPVFDPSQFATTDGQRSSPQRPGASFPGGNRPLRAFARG